MFQISSEVTMKLAVFVDELKDLQDLISSEDIIQLLIDVTHHRKFAFEIGHTKPKPKHLRGIFEIRTDGSEIQDSDRAYCLTISLETEFSSGHWKSVFVKPLKDFPSFDGYNVDQFDQHFVRFVHVTDPTDFIILRPLIE